MTRVRRKPRVVRYRLSVQAVAVLRALAAVEALTMPAPSTVSRRAGELTVRDLVRRVARPGVSRSVTRASLSRTLRRLWRDGLVELSASTQTMTAKRQATLNAIAEHERDPVAAYEGYQKFVKVLGVPDRHGSVAAFMAAQRARTERNPGLRVTHVQITETGRAWLTVACTSKLTDDETAQRLTADSIRELTDA